MSQPHVIILSKSRLRKMASQSDHLNDVDPNAGVSGESPRPVQQQADLSSSNDNPHPARDSGTQPSRASAGTSAQPQSGPRGIGGSPFGQTLRGYRIPKVQHVAGFDSPDPSSDSGTEGHQDGYDDSDDASESAYGDTPVPGPSGAESRRANQIPWCQVLPRPWFPRWRTSDVQPTRRGWW